MLKRMMIVFGCIMGAASLFQSAHAQEPASAETTSICEDWLSILDQGQYEQSWEVAGSYFKSMVSKEQWVAQASAVRNSLGDMVSRTFKDEKYSTSLLGAPDGEYVITIFSSSFKNKSSATETVVLMKDKDGQWRLAGYFVK